MAENSMDEATTELVRDWLVRASHDLQAARILATADNPLLDVAIYDFVLSLLPAEARP